jgi:pectate lyase
MGTIHIQVTKREYTEEGVWKNWIWQSQGDLMQNGAFFIQSGGKNSKRFSKAELIKSKPGTFVTRLTRFSGALNCQIGKEC